MEVVHDASANTTKGEFSTNVVLAFCAGGVLVVLGFFVFRPNSVTGSDYSGSHFGADKNTKSIVTGDGSRMKSKSTVSSSAITNGEEWRKLALKQGEEIEELKKEIEFLKQRQ